MEGGGGGSVKSEMTLKSAIVKDYWWRSATVDVCKNEDNRLEIHSCINEGER